MPMSFAKEARPFVLPVAALAAALFYFRETAWALAAAVLAVGVLLFFRDPRRRFDGEAGVVLAAADGLVTRVDELEDPAVGPGRFRRVVTFLSVFDVHVQKTPVEGRVIASELTRGRKVAAFRHDAGDVNEKHLTVFERAGGERVGVRQIAGLVARRVVCYLEPGRQVARGDPLGIIKFGSRVDVLVPEQYEILVSKGDRVRTAATPIARPAETPAAGP